MPTYRFTTDAGEQEIEAADADAAAAVYAADDGIRKVKTAEDLRAYIDRVGGYGVMCQTFSDGSYRVIWQVES